jgi:phage baseplate assembly protein W
MADANPKAFLGVGWSFPVKPVNGSLQFARYEDDVEQAIQIILLTSHGERVMTSGFGAGVRDFLFEPNSDATRARIADLVRRALVAWEPRILLEGVEVTQGDEPNLVLIHVDYVVQATNTSYNRVYPFYLLEGSS